MVRKPKILRETTSPANIRKKKRSVVNIQVLAWSNDKRTAVLLRPLRIFDMRPFLRNNGELSGQEIRGRSWWIRKAVDIVSTVSTLGAIYDEDSTGNGNDTDNEEGKHVH